MRLAGLPERKKRGVAVGTTLFFGDQKPIKVKSMQLNFNKSIEIPETWIPAFFFFFKLFTLITSAWLLVWYAVLRTDQSSWQTNYLEDYWFVASNLSFLFFLSAGLLVIGGLIQLWKRSGRSAWWNIGFGIFAIIIGIVLFVGVPPPDHMVEMLSAMF